MVTALASRLIMLVFGTLYPAYSSYKAMKTKNVREYVRWMMYWIVFALFITAELFADLLLGFWFPFYYEIKILFMLWLLSPATKGSSILYKKFVHPWLAKHEKDIDSYISQAKESGYDTFVRVSRNTISIAADTMVKTAVTGQNVLAEKLRQYGTDDPDGLDRREGRMRKARSWYGGMDSTNFDYDPIDETEEPIEEEPSSPDAESLKLGEELKENSQETKSRRGENNSPTKQKYATLPRSHGLQAQRSSSYSRLYMGDGPDFDPKMTKSQSGSKTRTYESSTLPRQYETRRRAQKKE